MVGITGESLESYVFFGPVYYQKLKHMGNTLIIPLSDVQSSTKCTQEQGVLVRHLRDNPRKVVPETAVSDSARWNVIV
jgi:hypothetical protein